MNSSNQSSDDKLFVAKALEATIHVGLVVLLLYWCFKIGQPFIGIIVWGIIFAVAIHPGYNRLKSALGGRGRLSAILITIVALIILLVPTYMLSGSLIETAKAYSAYLDAGTLTVPPPSENIRSWPVIGEPLYEFWSEASDNLGAALNKITPQLKKIGIPLLSAAAGAGVGILKFVVSIIIAGVLLANDAGGGRAARAIATRLAGERGTTAVELAVPPAISAIFLVMDSTTGTTSPVPSRSISPGAVERIMSSGEPVMLATMAESISLSPTAISSVLTASFSLTTGITPSVRR